MIPHDVNCNIHGVDDLTSRDDQRSSQPLVLAARMHHTAECLKFSQQPKVIKLFKDASAEAQDAHFQGCLL